MWFVILAAIIAALAMIALLLVNIVYVRDMMTKKLSEDVVMWTREAILVSSLMNQLVLFVTVAYSFEAFHAVTGDNSICRLFVSVSQLFFYVSKACLHVYYIERYSMAMKELNQVSYIHNLWFLATVLCLFLGLSITGQSLGKIGSSGACFPQLSEIASVNSAIYIVLDSIFQVVLVYTFVHWIYSHLRSMRSTSRTAVLPRSHKDMIHAARRLKLSCGVIVGLGWISRAYLAIASRFSDSIDPKTFAALTTTFYILSSLENLAIAAGVMYTYIRYRKMWTFSNAARNKYQQQESPERKVSVTGRTRKDSGSSPQAGREEVLEIPVITVEKADS